MFFKKTKYIYLCRPYIVYFLIKTTIIIPMNVYGHFLLLDLYPTFLVELNKF
jgi:hypothetical protein